MEGHFLSSSDLLNRIWYAGDYTLNLDEVPPGTAFGTGGVDSQHLILDGAKRDRAVWSGDQLIADLTDYYTGNPAYSRDSLALLLDHPASAAGVFEPVSGAMTQPGPLAGVCGPNPAVTNRCFTWSATYSMADVIALDSYYRYTGDLAFVRQHWAAVMRQMAWDAAQVAPGGLFAVTGSDAADWNIEVLSGELTYVNALYVECLHAAGDLAGALGKSTEAAGWNAEAAIVSTAVNAQLWDPSTGVYDSSTTSRGGIVQDANVTAVLAGVAGPACATSILHRLGRSLKSPYGLLSVASPVPAGYSQIISPYMGGLNVLADFSIDRATTALSLVEEEWGPMVSHDPGGVDWERMLPDGLTGGGGATAVSSAHAWSTGPTAALSEFVLGVTPATPGFAHWAIAPQPGGLHWAQGVVPTPHGSISVAWQRTDGSFVLTESAPHGTSGTVAIPVGGRGGVVALNGRVVWTAGRAVGGARARRVGGTAVFTVGGRATFASTAP